MSTASIRTILRARALQKIGAGNQNQLTPNEQRAVNQFQTAAPKTYSKAVTEAKQSYEAKQAGGRILGGAKPGTYETDSSGKVWKVTGVSGTLDDGTKYYATEKGVTIKGGQQLSGRDLVIPNKSLSQAVIGEQTKIINEGVAKRANWYKTLDRNVDNLNKQKVEQGINEENRREQVAIASNLFGINQKDQIIVETKGYSRPTYQVDSYDRAKRFYSSIPKTVMETTSKGYKAVDIKLGGILPGGIEKTETAKQVITGMTPMSIGEEGIQDIKNVFTLPKTQEDFIRQAPNIILAGPKVVLGGLKTSVGGLGVLTKDIGKGTEFVGEKGNIDFFKNLGKTIQEKPYTSYFTATGTYLGGTAIAELTTAGGAATSALAKVLGAGTKGIKYAGLGGQMLTAAGISQALKVQEPIYKNIFISKEGRGLLSDPNKLAEFENVIIPMGDKAEIKRQEGSNFFTSKVGPFISGTFEFIAPQFGSNKEFEASVRDYAKKKGYDPDLYAQTALGLKKAKDITYSTMVIQPEISSNRMAFFSPKRFYAGISEGTLSVNAMLDRYKEIGVPLTDGRVKIVSDWKPIEFKNNEVRIGKSLGLPAAAITGGLSAAGFRKLEFGLEKLGKPGKATASVLGYGLDFPEEPVGDILTGSVISRTRSQAKNIAQVGLASGNVNKPTSGFFSLFSLSPSKGSQTLSLTNIPAPTKATSLIDVTAPTTKINNKTGTDVFTDTKTGTDTFTNTETNTFIETFTDVFTNTRNEAVTFTPDLFPPVLPSGGGGGGDLFGRRGTRGRKTYYEPSLSGIITKTKAKKNGGVLTGLEIRGV